jgi:hypothetical protein
MGGYAYVFATQSKKMALTKLSREKFAKKNMHNELKKK